jgi:hypothetical protein
MLGTIAALTAGITQTPPPLPFQILDGFGRDVTSRGITLLDWEGQLANPAIKMSVAVPQELKYPAQIYLSGTSSRIHFDRSEAEDRTGIGKRIILNAAPAKPSEFYISMFPDRDGVDEGHALMVQIFSGGREVARTLMPVKVIDQDKPGTRGSYPIHLDLSEDRTNFTQSKHVRDVIVQAAEDWAYFMLDIGQDTVPAGAEKSPIWNPDGFVTQRSNVNKRAYNGYLMYVTGIQHDEMRAGGSPSLVGMPQTVKGQPTTLRRSGTVEFETRGNWNQLGWFLTRGDEDWWYSGSLRNEQQDLYSIALHEMGHALCFEQTYPVFGKARKSSLDDPRLVRYLGFAPKIDASEHLINVIDPVSLYGGYGCEYFAKMKARRWLITKSHLLCLQAIGYRVRKTAAFDELSVSDAKHEVRSGSSFDFAMPIRGGVPGYTFAVTEGSLPEGLRLDSFTGTVRGTSTQVGSKVVKVTVDDCDPTTPAVTASLELIVR